MSRRLRAALIAVAAAAVGCFVWSGRPWSAPDGQRDHVLSSAPDSRSSRGRPGPAGAVVAVRRFRWDPRPE